MSSTGLQFIRQEPYFWNRVAALEVEKKILPLNISGSQQITLFANICDVDLQMFSVGAKYVAKRCASEHLFDIFHHGAD